MNIRSYEEKKEIDQVVKSSLERMKIDDLIELQGNYMVCGYFRIPKTICDGLKYHWVYVPDCVEVEEDNSTYELLSDEKEVRERIIEELEINDYFDLIFNDFKSIFKSI